jgi:hypothetical protein
MGISKSPTWRYWFLTEVNRISFLDFFQGLKFLALKKWQIFLINLIYFLFLKNKLNLSIFYSKIQ